MYFASHCSLANSGRASLTAEKVMGSRLDASLVLFPNGDTAKLPPQCLSKTLSSASLFRITCSCCRYSALIVDFISLVIFALGFILFTVLYFSNVADIVLYLNDFQTSDFSIDQNNCFILLYLAECFIRIHFKLLLYIVVE